MNWKPVSNAPQDGSVFLAALWHGDTKYPRWEFALLYWDEGKLRFYDNETGWEPGDYTHYAKIDPPSTQNARAA